MYDIRAYKINATKIVAFNCQKCLFNTQHTHGTKYNVSDIFTMLFRHYCITTKTNF